MAINENHVVFGKVKFSNQLAIIANLIESDLGKCIVKIAEQSHNPNNLVFEVHLETLADKEKLLNAPERAEFSLFKHHAGKSLAFKFYNISNQYNNTIILAAIKNIMMTYGYEMLEIIEQPHQNSFLAIVAHTPTAADPKEVKYPFKTIHEKVAAVLGKSCKIKHHQKACKHCELRGKTRMHNPNTCGNNPDAHTLEIVQFEPKSRTGRRSNSRDRSRSVEPRRSRGSKYRS